MSRKIGNIANSVLIQKPNESTHNLSHFTLTSGKLGDLIPVQFQEVAPGDRWKIRHEFQTKCQPLAKAAMVNMKAYLHTFYVPYRLLWRNWNDFLRNSPAYDDVLPPVHPTVNVDGGAGFQLAAYFGFRSAVYNVSPFYFMAYQLIWNEYYRHPQIHTSIESYLKEVHDGDCGDLSDPTFGLEMNKIRKRTFKGDYFTAALPSPQNGNPAELEVFNMEPAYVHRNVTTLPTQVLTEDLTWDEVGTANQRLVRVDDKPNSDGNTGNHTNRLYIDGADIQATMSMNDLIELYRMQEFLVRQNLAGNRFNEFMLAFYGVRISDLRIGRPQYIGGCAADLVVSELLNTADHQGTQSGQANGYSVSGGDYFEAEEHGVVMTLYSCVPDMTYIGATQRAFYKKEHMEYLIPMLDQMGEREIYNVELSTLQANPLGTFGYIPQYAEYRLPFNNITGDFVNTLANWHFGRDLDTAVLNEDFFDIAGMDQIFAVDEETADPLLIRVFNECFVTRLLKSHSMPTLESGNPNQIMI